MNAPGVLQQATSCRGALDGFIAEVIEDHIREHMVDPPRASGTTRASLAAEELVDDRARLSKKVVFDRGTARAGAWPRATRPEGVRRDPIAPLEVLGRSTLYC